MDGSPRSSKRRKLDTPARGASSPLRHASSARKSGRLATRAVSYTNGEVQEARALRGSKSTTGMRHTHGATEEADVWDDIEGALGEKPTTQLQPSASKQRPSTSQNKAGTSKRAHTEDTTSTGDMTDELQPTTSTPKGRNVNGTVKRDSASRFSFRSLVNGYRHGTGTEPDIQIAADASTPSRDTDQLRPARRPGRRQADDRTNGTKFATPPKGRTRRTSKRGAPEADDDETVATPWTSSKRRASVRERSTIPDSEDELANRNSPSATISASTRRRAHRADHINNQAEEIVVPSDDEQAGVGALEEDDYGMEVDGNSAMGSVLDPTEPSPFNKPASAQKTKPALRLLHGHLEPGHERQLEVLKSIMLERIAGKRPGALIGLAEEYKTVHQLIEHTVTAGESNSMLLIGARGSGKSALVNKVLSEISKENSEDYHIVRLNGFIHTDDKIALREIWRQLGKEMDLDEEGGGVGKNYADTLTTLLALLSHHSEHTGEVTDQVAKAVIFIMDEFDHFAQHPRQTLLYNLFDIAQSRKAPIAVLGLTTRIDVANSLEKRVKSRFSHRYVHLSLAKTFTAFQETCKANLLVLSEQLNVEERGILEGAVQATPAKKGKKGAKQDLLLQWNANVNALFASKTFLTMQLGPHFYRTKSVPSVLNAFLFPAATLSPTLAPEPSSLLAPPDSKLSLIPHLSTLSLSLLIAAARLDIIHDSDTCNFNMAYDEYVTLASKARIQSAAGGSTSSSGISKVWGKEVARRGWEGLVELGLVMPVVGGLTGAFGMCRADVSLEEIGGVLAGEKSVERGLERWCRQI